MGLRRIAVAVCTAAVVGVGAGSAFAGEVKGPPSNGPTTDYTAARTHANSICAYSGLNDNPTSTNPMDPPGRVQSYGQDVREGRIDPRLFNPGDVCQGGSNHNRP
jgi:hypothetical protein